MPVFADTQYTPALGAALFTDLNSVPAADIARWRTDLSAADQKRNATFRSTDRKRAFITARALLSQLVETELGARAEVNSLCTGQPFLLVNGRRVACSISHSATSVLVAYSLDGPVGVDIEAWKSRQVYALVQRYFHADELNTYNNLAEHRKLAWFYDLWCRKEAVLKLKGTGISAEALAEAADMHPEVKVLHLSLPGYSAAIASTGASQPAVFRFTRAEGTETFEQAPLTQG